MRLHKQDIPFTMVANEVLYRSDITLKAKGLFAYLFSKPEGWDFAAERIATECKESRKSVLTALQELEHVGLLKRSRHGDGRMEYSITYAADAVPESTARLFPATKVKGRTLTTLREGEIIPIGDGALVNDLLKMFEPINPSYERLFANKTQRAALSRLIGKIGEEKVRGAILAAQQSFGKPYAPTITTPMQLEERIGSLASFFKKQSRGAAVVAL